MSESAPNQVTALLLEWRQGNVDAWERLWPLIYDELRRLAQFHMRGERTDHTLQPTALVHEAYARMINLELSWQDRTHFFSMAARTMRRVLVDHARAQRSAKRGEGLPKITLREDRLPPEETDWDLLDLDRALDRLRSMDERQSQVVELYYFGGLSYVEIAEATQMSRATVGRAMRHAKAWLRHELAAGA